MEEPQVSLKKLFEEGQRNFQLIQQSTLPSIDPKVQEQCRTCLELFETCSKIVTQQQIFSKNEEIDDVQTGSLQYSFFFFFSFVFPSPLSFFPCSRIFVAFCACSQFFFFLPFFRFLLLNYYIGDLTLKISSSERILTLKRSKVIPVFSLYFSLNIFFALRALLPKKK
jgi:hypothetical protein